MLTLHQATEEIKTTAKWGSILVITVISVYLLFNGGKVIKAIIDPPKPPPPTVCLGKLTNVEFPVDVPNEIESYTQDTLEGKLPDLSDRIEVFEIEQPEPNLLALKKAEEKLASIDFKENSTPVSDTTYLWENPIPPNKKIKYDILRQNFELTSDYLNDQEVLSANNLPNEKESITIVKNFLIDIKASFEDIDEQKTKTDILSIRDGKLAPASSISLAQAVKVHFYQKDVNKLPIYYSNYPASSINLLVAAGGYEGQIIEANYFYNKVKPNNKECTYPIKTAEQAFEELKKGKGHVAAYSGTDRNISVKNVFLAYYMENKPSKYLLPIFVFEGNDGFVAFLKAITDSWLTN